MRRYPVNKKASHGAFKRRAGKTHRLNLGGLRRGGIRL